MQISETESLRERNSGNPEFPGLLSPADPLTDGLVIDLRVVHTVYIDLHVDFRKQDK